MKKTSIFILLALLTLGPRAWAQTFGGGSGTQTDPYIISNNDHWNTLVDAVNNGTGAYASAYYKLNGKISGIANMLGTAEHPFSGTFDGNGHEISLWYQQSQTYYAPFRYVDGATIQNLHVSGIIHTSSGVKYVASFIAHSVGTTNLTNCHSDVQINTNGSGGQYHSGMVAEIAEGSLTITGCVFDGIQLIFNDANSCGGFVGWLAQGATVTIADCVLDPYAQLTNLGNGSYTFVNAADPSAVTLTNCYYTCSMGQAQGKRARSIIGGDGITVAFDGNATTYSLTGITSYDASQGLQYNDNLYAGEGDLVNLNISNTVGATSYIINTEPLIGDGNPYSITMPNEDLNIYTALIGTGTQDDPYLIYTTSDFNQIATMVEHGQNFSGQYIQLENDISVTRTVGSDGHRFSGIFNGNGKTITVNLTTSVWNFGPFVVVDGATFQDLTIAGTIDGSYQRVIGGFIGKSYGNTTLTNCHSDVTINSTYSGDAGNGGFVGYHDQGHLIIDGCVFTGKFLGSSNRTYGYGGFVGYNYGTLTITNSLFYPTEVTIGANASKTFAKFRNSTPTITNSYYTQTLGEAQGERIYFVNLADGITSSANFLGYSLSVSDATITLDCEPLLGYEPVFTVKDSDNQNVTVNHIGDEYSFTMPAKNVTVTLSYNSLPMTGDGTQDNPYFILTTEHWNTVCNNVNDIVGNYPSANYRLDADITITNKMMGSPESAFQGTFDGNGHTITMNYNGSLDGIAPFRVAKNAAISNLHVNGTLGCNNYNGSIYFLGGLIGFADGTVTIENCRVSSDLHIHTFGGGLVGLGQGATLNIVGCVFDGTILNTTSDTDSSQGVGGLVGWADAGCTMNITNSFFAGTYTCDGSTYVPFSPIACSADGSNTTTVTNTYYTLDPDTDSDNPNNIVSTAAKRAYTISGGENVSLDFSNDPTVTYNVSDITIYTPGIKYNDVYYAGNDEPLSLTIDAEIPENYAFMGYEVSSGILGGTANPYTLTIRNNDVVINVKIAEEWEGDGSEETPYLIYNSDQLDLLATRVNAGITYQNNHFKLMNDIAYDPNVFTIDNNGDGVNESNYTAIGTSNNYFRGLFDGDNHTISGIRIVKNAGYQGLFGRCASGEVKNLILSDANIVGNNNTGGIVGYSQSDLINCHVTSTVIIRTTKTNVDYHGGIVGYHYGSILSFCTSSATLTIENGNSGCEYYGGIFGYNKYGTVTDNFAINATVPGAFRYYGAIYGDNNITSNFGSIQRNYCHGCTVNGIPNSTGGNDIYNNDGAVYGYFITLEEFVTSSAASFTIPEHKDVNGTTLETIAPITYVVAAVGNSITLSHTLPAGCIFEHYIVDDEAIEGNTFTMYQYNLTVGIAYSVDVNTVSRVIPGYGDSEGGYVLISSPVGAVNPANISHMFDNEFDLYAFDQEAELEWRNYKTTAFELAPGKGYLYANSEDVTLVFPGTPYHGDGRVTLSKTTGAEWEGWNLVGNPFNEIAYIDDGRPFYTMNPTGSEIIVTTSNSIEAMEGLFVIADYDGETMTFTTEQPANNDKSLTLNLFKGRGVIDRAIISFGEGRTLPKFQINRNSTKVYIHRDNKDYAVINAEAQGELPVSFKAEENGTYTLSLSSDKVSFDYLHLIDNLTGADVDLLVNPSYTFEAKNTDYASRFKLVFVCGDANGDNDFAFISNGDIIVNGEGTLQVIDVMGRIVLSGDAINRVSTSGMTPGVYVFRLINGDDVKTQKIVVR